MEQKFTEMELVKRIYTDTPERMWTAASFNVNHHLVKLLKEHKVKQVDQMWKYKENDKF